MATALLSIGRLVHFVESSSAPHRPFLVVEVLGENQVAGWVFSPHTLYYAPYVVRNDAGEAGTWHWPELVQ